MSSLANATTITYSIGNSTNFVAAILIFVVGVFGVICNSSIMVAYIIDPDKTSFNLICFFRATINVYALVTTFLGVFLTSTILGHSIFSEAFESWNLNLSMTLYLGNEYQIAMVALNRFCALFFPRHYAKIFAIRSTLLVLAVFVLYRLVVMIYMTDVDISRGCYYSFSVESLTWAYPLNPMCLFEDNIMTIILATFIFCTCLNMVTFSKIIKFYRSFQSHDRDTQRRIKKNALLFFQTVLQDSLYIIDMAFTYKLSMLFDNRFWTFVSGTLVWECLHAFDGFIMLMFNDRLALFRGRNESPITSSIVAPARFPVHQLGSVS